MLFPAGDPVDQVYYGGGADPPVGGTVDTTSSFAPADGRLNASAVVEPDADGDAFGDETQDACRGTAGPAGGRPLPPPPDITKPTVLSLRFAKATFRAAARGAAVARAPIGSRVRYALSESATTRFTVERRTTGRRSGRRCVAPTRRNRRARRCVRHVREGERHSHRPPRGQQVPPHGPLAWPQAAAGALPPGVGGHGCCRQQVGSQARPLQDRSPLARNSAAARASAWSWYSCWRATLPSSKVVTYANSRVSGTPLAGHAGRVGEHDEPVPQVDELNRLKAGVRTPDLGRGGDVGAVTRQAAVARLDQPCVDQVARRPVLEIPPPADHDRLQIVAVVCLRRCRRPRSSAACRRRELGGSRATRPKRTVASQGIARKPLVERAARPLSTRSGWRTGSMGRCDIARPVSRVQLSRSAIRSKKVPQPEPARSYPSGVM